MLGNGDESPRQRNKHSTYLNKPTPAMQLASQLSHFNEEGRSSNAYKATDPNSIPAVPTTWDTVYDPSHPDADWSGMVSKAAIQQKKHNPNHANMQETLERTAYGIVSKEDAHEFARKRNVPEIANKNAGSLVIAGIDDPINRYNSSYRRFEHHEITTKDQLTLEKRMNVIKKVQDPLQSSQNHYNASDNSRRNTPQAVGSRTSLLSGLGDKLISTKVVDVPSHDTGNSNSGGPNKKLLITDNYNPFPGMFVYIFYDL